jgi:hypothetical protein
MKHFFTHLKDELFDCLKEKVIDNKASIKT